MLHGFGPDRVAKCGEALAPNEQVTRVPLEGLKGETSGPKQGEKNGAGIVCDGVASLCWRCALSTQGSCRSRHVRTLTTLLNILPVFRIPGPSISSCRAMVKSFDRVSSSSTSAMPPSPFK